MAVIGASGNVEVAAVERPEHRQYIEYETPHTGTAIGRETSNTGAFDSPAPESVYAPSEM